MMKEIYPRIALAKLCGWFGISRQAYYQKSWYETDKSLEEHLIIQQVLEIRKKHRRMGGRKLYEKLYPFMLEHQIKMGRDALFNLLAANNLLIKRRKRRIQTTWSSHWLRKYPNLIKEFTPIGINQLWVSDITYWKTDFAPLYISFITDVFSHKIVGYHVSDSLSTEGSLKALRKAFSACEGAESLSQLVHHSDRGVQYCSSAYVELLKKHNIRISMTENGDPLENAVAERVNGIIKEEYLNEYQVGSMGEAEELLEAVIHLYNDDRPHMSIGNLTPNHVLCKNLKTKKLWKNYWNKNKNIVNPIQDKKKTVNLLQD
ncbi:MAG: IS3 family transposase [Bacteroidota bacterium]